MTVFNFGSINIDKVYRVPHLVQPGETLASTSLDTVLGGKGANQSVALARASAKVCHIGRVGKDDQWAVDDLADAGVDVSFIEFIDDVSGHAIIQVDDQGENSIILHGGANQTIDHSTLARLLAHASPGDWLLMQNECSGMPAAFKLAEELGLRIAINPAPMDPSVMQLPLVQSELIIVNETEAAFLVGQASAESTIEQLSQRFPESQIVLTLGAKGALLFSEGAVFSEPGFTMDVVDTTGAGDTFVGYFLAGLIQDLKAVESLRRACAAAALSVGKAGATPSIPSLEAVEAFLN